MTTFRISIIFYLILLSNDICIGQQSINDILNYSQRNTGKINQIKIEFNKCKIKNIESNWYGLEFIWLKIPLSNTSFSIEDISKQIKPKSEIKIYDEDLVIISGGFYDIDKKFDGLVKIGNNIKSNFKDWEEGGFLIQAKEINILPVNTYKNIDINRTKYILQTKPIVTKDGKNEIFVNSISRSNRIGIGFDNSDNLLICLAYNDNGKALSLYEFAELLVDKKINADTFLALDGGPSVILQIPKLNIYEGVQENTYIANILHIKSK